MLGNLLIAFLNVFNVIISCGFPAVQVIMRMITDLMAIVNYLFKNIRMLFDVIADAKERRFDIKLSERIKDKFCGTWHGPIVKCQKQLLVVRWNPPR